MKRIFSSILIVSLCILLCSCSVSDEVEQTEMSTTTERTTEQSETLQQELLADFSPFECSGSYYSFDKSRQPVSENGMKFYCTNRDSDESISRIVYSLNGAEKTLFEVKADILIDGYVDNALYFHTFYNNPALYRIEMYCNETGDIVDSKLSLVSTGYHVLVRALENSLILSDSEGFNGKYALLDTQTGELTETEYMRQAEYSEFSDVAYIDETEALNIARDALSKSDYWKNAALDIGEDIPEFRNQLSSEFIVNPFYIVGRPGITLETYPDYAWEFTLDYSQFTVYISVNAVTGTICYVDTQLND